MLINLPLCFGSAPTGPNEGRMLVDSLRTQLASLYEQTQPDLIQIRTLACLSLSVLDAFVAHASQYDACREPDGRGDYQTVYRPRPLSASVPSNLTTTP